MGHDLFFLCYLHKSMGQPFPVAEIHIGITKPVSDAMSGEKESLVKY